MRNNSSIYSCSPSYFYYQSHLNWKISGVLPLIVWLMLFCFCCKSFDYVCQYSSEYLQVFPLWSFVGGRHGAGKISASGGNGLAGGGGGRVSINVFSRHDDTQIFVHGNFFKSEYLMQIYLLFTLHHSLWLWQVGGTNSLLLWCTRWHTYIVVYPYFTIFFYVLAFLNLSLATLHLQDMITWMLCTVCLKYNNIHCSAMEACYATTRVLLLYACS